MGKRKVSVYAVRLTRSLLLILAAILLLGMPFGSQTAQAKIKLNKKSKTLTVGNKVQLKVKGLKKKYKAKVTWKSSKKSVATVSKKGLVKAKKKGTAKITATIKGKGIKKTKKTCKITVKKKKTKKKNTKKTETKKIETEETKITETEETKKTETEETEKTDTEETKKPQPKNPNDVLWEYIRKSGTKDEEGDYCILEEEDNWDEEYHSRAYVFAETKKPELHFIYHYSTDTPPFGHSISLTIDLKSSQEGTLDYGGNTEDYSEDQVGLAGNITTDYDGKSAGITWTYEEIDYDDSQYPSDELPENVKTDEVEEIYAQRANHMLADAFAAWDQLVQKAGKDVTMNALGFTAYK